MNPTATSATTSRQKRVRTDPTTTTQMIDLTTPAPTTKTTPSPTKSAIQALEGITASLPSSLHPLVLHFDNKLISIRSKCITKENIAKHMTKEPNYIPKSAKATDFKITLSKGALEDSERVSFLEQQIQQAKDTYESSLKNVIEECISLETTALQSQENDMIYTLLASIAAAINTLEGIKTDVHQKVISLIYLDCSFISYTTSTSWDSFISSYCTHHNLETIPSPTIHPLASYPTQLLHHGTPSFPAIVPTTTWKQSLPLQSIHYRLPTPQPQNVTLNSSFTQSHYNDKKMMDYKLSAKPSKVLSSCLP